MNIENKVSGCDAITHSLCFISGETSFPRWLNAETRKTLSVKPEKGKAVLFYMLLPDGNSDDLSQHSGDPVIRGEKWMSNLWVWDPFMSK